MPSFDFLSLWISYVIYNIYFLLKDFGGFLCLCISYAICNIHFLLEDFVVCEGRCTHVHVKSRGQLRTLSRFVCKHRFFNMGDNWTWGSSIWLDVLMSEPQRSAWHCHPSTEIPSGHPHSSFLCECSGSNSGTNSCEASTLPSELFLQHP